MEAIKDLLGVIIAALSIIGTLTGAALYLLNIYFRKANELQAAKSDQHIKSVEAVNKEVTLMKDAASSFQRQLHEFQVELVKHAGKIEKFDQVATQMQRQWEKTAEELHKRYQALENAEVLQVGKNTFLLKTRRPGA